MAFVFIGNMLGDKDVRKFAHVINFNADAKFTFFG